MGAHITLHLEGPAADDALRELPATHGLPAEALPSSDPPLSSTGKLFAALTWA